MSIRRRSLPTGWYPADERGIEAFLASGMEESGEAGSADQAIAARPGTLARAVVAPHAGWAYSGALAARAVSSLCEAETVVIFGGHLSGHSAPLAATEEAFDTPLGPILADLDLRGALDAELLRMSPFLRLKSDELADNSVEVHLPLVKHRFRSARLLWLRAPNSPHAIELGRALAAAAGGLGRSIAVLGSTDLTHYGPTYGFAPKGSGVEAEAWVRNVNDARFIEALLALDAEEALRRADAEGSACSAGAAAAALAYALASGATRAELLGYANSLDVRSDSSFVGYAAVGFF